MTEDQRAPKEDQPSSPTATARVAVELLEMARIVCAHARATGGKKLKLTDYLDSILRPVITRDHAATLARVAESQKGKGKKS